MGRQLGHGHHPLGDQVADTGRVLRAKPTHRQARHMGAQPVAAGLQYRYANAHPGLLYPAAPPPGGRHGGQQRQQPAACPLPLALQQLGHQRQQQGGTQATQRAVQGGHPGIAAQQRRLRAQQ